ncbi:hypothetical protein GF373_04955 [bacterium]|nr:hypothetical protein [bacterium]
MPLNPRTRASLVELIPHGTLATRNWLLAKGLSHHSLDNLVKSGQLISISKGVYIRPETVLKWEGVVSSLQRMGSDLVLGGLSALEKHGLTHYVSMSEQKTIHVYGFDTLPSWINRLGLSVTFRRHGNFQIWGEANPGGPNLCKKFTVDMPWSEFSLPLRVSPPERAICEVLNDVPEAFSFEHADQLMQGLPGLSPRRLKEILRLLKSVKVKRLFFWLAERQNHAWFKKLDPSQFDLGRGKRVFVEEGKLNKKYQILVPKEMHG